MVQMNDIVSGKSEFNKLEAMFVREDKRPASRIIVPRIQIENRLALVKNENVIKIDDRKIIDDEIEPYYSSEEVSDPVRVLIASCSYDESSQYYPAELALRMTQALISMGTLDDGVYCLICADSCCVDTSCFRNALDSCQYDNGNSEVPVIASCTESGIVCEVTLLYTDDEANDDVQMIPHDAISYTNWGASIVWNSAIPHDIELAMNKTLYKTCSLKNSEIISTVMQDVIKYDYRRSQESAEASKVINVYDWEKLIDILSCSYLPPTGFKDLEQKVSALSVAYEDDATRSDLLWVMKNMRFPSYDASFDPTSLIMSYEDVSAVISIWRDEIPKWGADNTNPPTYEEIRQVRDENGIGTICRAYYAGVPLSDLVS